MVLVCRAYQAVWDDAASDGVNGVSWGEEHLGALTAWDRTSWAKARDKHFSTGVNKISLDIIEKVLAVSSNSLIIYMYMYIVQTQMYLYITIVMFCTFC